MLKPITFEIVGPQQIVCEGCVERVETALKTLAGVKKARANARNQRVEVLLDTSMIKPDAVVEKLGAVGFQARFSQPVSSQSQPLDQHEEAILQFETKHQADARGSVGRGRYRRRGNQRDGGC